MAVPLLLAGCSSYSSSSLNPVNWWHNLEGGEIAQQRPPPPGADQAYPNLATVPAKPTAPDQKELQAITQGLVADRAHAEYMAAATPIADPSSPQASPGLFGTGTMPPPPPPGAPVPAPTATASLSAANGPPPSPPAPEGPPPKPLPAPRGSVQSAPLPSLAAASPPPAASPAAPPAPAGSGPKPAMPAASAPTSAAANTPPVAPTAQLGPTPPVPARPPAPPNVPGAPPARVAMAEPTPPAAPKPGVVTIEFVAGSSDLPPGANDLLKELAAKRGNAVIAVTGHGDTAGNDPSAQVTGLNLALARAEAAAKALTGDGVPPADVRIAAEASGRGVDARLIQ